MWINFFVWYLMLWYWCLFNFVQVECYLYLPNMPWFISTILQNLENLTHLSIAWVQWHIFHAFGDQLLSQHDDSSSRYGRPWFILWMIPHLKRKSEREKKKIMTVPNIVSCSENFRTISNNGSELSLSLVNLSYPVSVNGQYDRVDYQVMIIDFWLYD